MGVFGPTTCSFKLTDTLEMTDIKAWSVSFSSWHDSKVQYKQFESAVTFICLLRAVVAPHTHTHTHNNRRRAHTAWCLQLVLFVSTQGLTFNLLVLRGISLDFGLCSGIEIVPAETWAEGRKVINTARGFLECCSVHLVHLYSLNPNSGTVLFLNQLCWQDSIVHSFFYLFTYFNTFHIYWEDV